MDIVDEHGTVKAGARHSAKTLAAIRAARDALNELLESGTNPVAGKGVKTSEEENIMTTVTKEELDANIAKVSAKAAKKAAKETLQKERKAQAKKAKKKAKAKAFMREMAEKNANNGGDITAGEEESAVHGTHQANDVNSIPDGGKVEGQYLNKQGKSKKQNKQFKELAKSVQASNELLAKMAGRPRNGGPVLDGQARGAFPASEKRLSETVTKGAEDLDIQRLEKSFAETTDPMIKMQIGEDLTLRRLRQGIEAGLI
jgi:hypothetical protein